MTILGCFTLLVACYNPLIDWGMSSITFRTSAAGMATLTSPSKSLELYSIPPSPSSNPCLQAHPGLASHPLETPPSDLPKAPGLPCPPISFINAAAFQRACKLEGSIPFSLSLSSMSARAAAICNGTPDDPVDLTRVPPEYHDYTDVFSKKKADTLAPHQPFNLKIVLEEGTEPPIGRLYSLSPSEQEFLWDFLDKHLTNSFICQSSSPHAAPVLFISMTSASIPQTLPHIASTSKMSSDVSVQMDFTSSQRNVNGIQRLSNTLDISSPCLGSLWPMTKSRQFLIGPNCEKSRTFSPSLASPIFTAGSSRATQTSWSLSPASPEKEFLGTSPTTVGSPSST